MYTVMQTEKSKRRKTRCMFRDAKGRWWLDYYTPDGKRRRKLAGRIREDAERMLRGIQTTVDQGSFVDASSAPGFTDFCAMYDERHGQHLSSPKKSKGRLMRWKDYFGNRKLSTITSGHIEDYRTERLATGKARDRKSTVSRVTINREVELVRVVLGKAVKWGYLSRNPAEKVEDYDEKGSKRERYLTRAEVLRLLQATKRSDSPFLRPVVYLELETGMRKAELFALRWSDVDFETGQLLIKKTKTGVQRRVPLSRRARWLLAKRAALAPLSTWVFESSDRAGNPAALSDCKKAYAGALVRARIENFRFHDLRHTFASHFAMKGGNVYALAKILGHSSPKMTLDRYAHLSPEYVNEQKSVMDRPSYSPKA